MIKSEDIEQLFIQEELYKHSDYLSDLFVDRIEQKDIIKSEQLLNVFQDGNPFTITDNKLEMKFPNYGRFIEIQSKKKIRSNSVSSNALLWGVKDKKATKKKNVDWYTINVYGSINRLIGTLMYGFSDIERQRIINLLKSK